MTSEFAFELSSSWIALAVFLQALEMWSLRREWRRGVWSWDILRDDFRGPLQPVFDGLLGRGFAAVVLVQLFSAALFLALPVKEGSASIHAVALSTAAAMTLLTSMRWRGSFNGGADSMTALVLISLSVAAWNPALVPFCLWFVSVQLVLSFFIAGCAKIRIASWRNGRAIAGFLLQSNYGVPQKLQKAGGHQKFMVFLGWLILLFELSFPLALTHRSVATIYIALAICFQIGNFFAFGLNRFLFAWAAAYPALYFCAHA